MKKILGYAVAFLLLAGALHADNIAPSLTWRYSNTYTVLTSTATNINLTTTATCPSCKILVTVENLSGGGGLNYDIDANATSSTLNSSDGLQMAAGSQPLVWGPYGSQHWLHLLAVSSSATVYVRLEAIP